MDQHERDLEMIAILQRQEHQARLLGQQAQLANIQKELAALREAVQQENQKPQCPVCGGRLEEKFRKCRHCNSDLIWSGGIAGELGKDEELQAKVADIVHKELAEQSRLNATIRDAFLNKDTRVICDRCRERVERQQLVISSCRGSRTADGQTPLPWFSFTALQLCPRCAGKDHETARDSKMAIGCLVVILAVVALFVGCPVMMAT